MYEPTLHFAKRLDREDTLSHYRRQFYFPQHNGKDAIYFCGNSLGLQPKSAEAATQQVFEQWRTLGVEGHFAGERPWTQYHKLLAQASAHIVGAKPEEVVVMNTLTVNLHLMLVSFYRPTKERYKIIMEGGAFPSDQYAVESQVKWHGFAPKEAIIEVFPRKGEELLRTEDIISTIEQHASETALVLFSGINYYTGQLFDMAEITKAGHQAGALVGFDLAHAAGNVPLQMHDWDVDFAVWCTYKYLNGGPGAPSGTFIHERHAFDKEVPRFAGWWGHDEERRFLMEKGFVPMPGAEGWQLSNASILAFAPLKASLDQIYEVGMPALRRKSEHLTGHLEYLIWELNAQGHQFEIITPENPAERGCQLSISATGKGKQLFHYLTENGVVLDWREPNVVRVAPTPLYNSFENVWQFVDLLRQFD